MTAAMVPPEGLVFPPVGRGCIRARLRAGCWWRRTSW